MRILHPGHYYYIQSEGFLPTHFVALIFKKNSSYVKNISGIYASADFQTTFYQLLIICERILKPPPPPCMYIA